MIKRILITGHNSKVAKAFEEYTDRNSLNYKLEKISLRDTEVSELNMKNYDVVLHVAGITKSDEGNIPKKEAEQYYRVNRDLTIKVAEKAKADGVKQFIYLSTMMVYGNAAPVGKRFEINENTKPLPPSHYGKSKLEAEEIIKLSNDTFKVLVIREPVIYGELFDGEMMKLSKLAKKIPAFPKIDSKKSWIYQGNLCEFIRLGIDKTLSGFYCPQDMEKLSISQIYKKCAKLQGKKCIIIPGLYPILRLAARFYKPINTICGDISYEESFSTYKDVDYQKYDWDESLKRMIGIMNE